MLSQPPQHNRLVREERRHFLQPRPVQPPHRGQVPGSLLHTGFHPGPAQRCRRATGFRPRHPQRMRRQPAPVERSQFQWRAVILGQIGHTSTVWQRFFRRHQPKHHNLDAQLGPGPGHDRRDFLPPLGFHAVRTCRAERLPVRRHQRQRDCAAHGPILTSGDNRIVSPRRRSPGGPVPCGRAGRCRRTRRRGRRGHAARHCAGRGPRRWRGREWRFPR